MHLSSPFNKFFSCDFRRHFFLFLVINFRSLWAAGWVQFSARRQQTSGRGNERLSANFRSICGVRCNRPKLAEAPGTHLAANPHGPDGWNPVHSGYSAKRAASGNDKWAPRDDAEIPSIVALSTESSGRGIKRVFRAGWSRPLSP